METKVESAEKSTVEKVVLPVEYGTHIKFVPGPPKPKTLTWWVVNKYDNGQIGWVGWYAAWRKYGYFAKPETVYEQVCLREIADFCERKTREHKQNIAICIMTASKEGEHGTQGSETVG